MGYYTQHDISNNSEEVQQALKEVSGYEYIQEEDIKWYRSDEDCKTVSLMFPDQLISVSGVGEEQPDIWIIYAKNGKLYREAPDLTFPEFDETKLK